MATKILVFDPLVKEEMGGVENELDALLLDGFEIVGAVGGNRPGVAPKQTVGKFKPASETTSPVYKDYVVLILHRE